MTWTKRDLLLYALGIGAKHDELEYVYGQSQPPELLFSFGRFPLRSDLTNSIVIYRARYVVSTHEQVNAVY